MSAYHEIYVLLYSYAELIDAGDFEGLGDLLAHAELTFEGFDQVRRGRDEVIDLYQHSTRRYPDDGTPKTKHVMTNVVVEIDESAEPQTATARSYFTVLQAVPGALPLQPVVAGRYRDRFELAEGGWRFTARHMVVDLVGEVGHHLLFGL